MAVLARAIVQLGLDDRDLIRGYERSIRATQAFADATERVGASMTLGVTAPALALGGAVLKAAGDLESLRKGLEAVAGSNATEQLGRLAEIAKLPGIGFEEAIQGSVRLQAVGFSAQGAERSLKAFANAIALTGGGRAELASVTVQLGQLSAKGKVLAQDLRPIIEASPAVGKALREAFGTVDSEQIQALGLSTGEFLDTLLSRLERLPTVQGGLKNAFENLADSGKRALAVLSDDETVAVTRRIEDLGSSAERLTKIYAALDPTTKRIALSMVGIAAAVGPSMLAFSKLAGAVAVARAGFVTIAGLPATLASGFRTLNSALIATQAGLTFNAAAGRFQAASGVFVARSAAMAAAATGTSRAFAAMQLAAGGLVRFLTGPVGIVLGLGAAAAAFVNFKIGAAKAKVAAEDFRDSLVDLTQTQLYLRRIDLATEMQELASAMEMIPKKLASTTSMGIGAPGVTVVVDNPAFVQAQQRMGELRAGLEILSESVAELGAVQPLGDFGAAETESAFDRLSAATKRLLSIYDSTLSRRESTTGLLGELLTAESKLERVIRAQGNQRTEDLERALALSTTIRGVWDDISSRMTAKIAVAPPDESKPLPGSGGRGMFLLERAAAEFLAKIERIKMPELPPLEGPARLDRILLNLFQPLQQLRRAVDDAGGRLALLGAYGADKLNFALLGLYDTVSRLTPMGLAAEVIGSAMEALAPALNALLVPVQIAARVFGEALVPVLAVLFPVFKGLGLAVAYIGEGIFRVADALASGIAAVLVAIGKAINLLPGSPGDPLIRAGKRLADFFNASIDAMQESQDGLRGLTWGEAINGVENLADAAHRAAESLSNVPEIFDLAVRRRMAAVGGLSPALTPATAGGIGVPRGGATDRGGSSPAGGITINIVNPPAGTDSRQLAAEVRRELVQGLRLGGHNEFSLAIQRAALGR